MDRYHAWLELIAQRDAFYLQTFSLVAVGWLAYKTVGLARRWAVAGATVAVGAGLAWGVWQWA